MGFLLESPVQLADSQAPHLSTPRGALHAAGDFAHPTDSPIEARLTCAMNCWALFSQERSSAKARQASREMASAFTQAARRSSSSVPTGWLPITSRGPVTG